MSKKYYPDVKSDSNFASISEEVLSFWKEEAVFKKSIENRPKEYNGQDNEFIFFDGPPFANGLPHYGHLLTGFVKDIVARYQTLKGKRVERRFGWDCHGLPVEMQSEKELGISGRIQISEYGIDKFNDHCRKSVMKYTNEWEDYVTQQARWVDFKNSYKTMDINYMESSLYAFKKLYDQGLVYKSERVMPYSWACETPLSNFETRMDNSYRKVSDKSVFIKFKLNKKPQKAPDGYDNYYVLVWTTTPWTLPSNLALAVGKKMEYSCVPLNGDCIITATSSLAKHKKALSIESNDYSEYTKLKGEDFAGYKYEPLFCYFKDHPNAFKVLEADFVEEGEGTGIVHIAPGFGEDDQLLCKEHDIELVCPVDDAGKFTTEVHEFTGMQVFETNDKIIIRLKEKGNWFKTEQYIHNYPHCWRTDTPLIYKAVPSWYIKVTDIKDKLIKNNQKINWIPGYIKDGLFGKWLENVRDWSISRNRFWGTPIPIWLSDDPKYPHMDVYGSIAELEKDFGVEVKDLHRPYIDDLTRKNPDDPTGKSMMKRVSDVFDCWFDSGSMPYAQVHYPFENKEKLEKHPSADFIVEYTAQTRGWFYTLTVLTSALFDKPAFLNCICHGVILDNKGQKLSKRLKNYMDPMEIFKLHGSDPLRFFMSASNVMRGQELHLDKDGKVINDTVRLVLKPIWNTYNFFTLYANSDGIKAKEIQSSSNLNDKYILSKLKFAIASIEAALDSYDLPNACNALTHFFEILNNWHIRRNRNRFWRYKKDQDKQEAYDTLYTVLCNISIAASPLLPMLLEHIYLGLVSNGEFIADSSVHLQNFPDSSKFEDYPELVDNIDKIRDICTAALNIRNTKNIRIRQPLSKLIIVGEGLSGLKEYFGLIKDEINVKEIVVSEDIQKYAKRNLKINFKIVGKRLAHKIKDLIAANKDRKWSQNKDGNIEIEGEILSDDEFLLVLEPLDGNPAIHVIKINALISLDINLTETLEQEGLARDFVRLIQQARKEAGLHVSDKIIIDVDAVKGKVYDSIKNYEDYISEQTLATKINHTKIEAEYLLAEEHNIEGKKFKIGLNKS